MNIVQRIFLVTLFLASSVSAQVDTSERIMQMIQALSEQASQSQNEGNYELAEQSRRQLISLMVHVNFGAAEIARQHSNLASVLNLINKPEEAQIELEKALEILDEFPTDDMVQLAVLNGNLGEALFMQGFFEAAREKYEEELSILQRQSMESTHFSASAHIGIGAIDAVLGNYEDALTHYEFAIPIILGISDESHPVTSRVLQEYEELQENMKVQ